MCLPEKLRGKKEKGTDLASHVFHHFFLDDLCLRYICYVMVPVLCTFCTCEGDICYQDCRRTVCDHCLSLCKMNPGAPHQRKTIRKMECGGQPKGRNNKKNGVRGSPKEKPNVCVFLCIGLRPRHMLSIPSTKLEMECGAAQRENNRKMECVCVVWSVGAAQREKQSGKWSVGQPKGKTIRKMSARVCTMECGAAQKKKQ
jgi:hypothetical protein